MPKYFDIEDTQTGKKYRVETDDDAATYDEAVDYFSTLPEDQWTQYEYKIPAATPVAQTKTPQVALSPEEVAPVAVPKGPVEVAQVTPQEGDYKLGMDDFLDFSPESTELSKIDQRQLLTLINNPNVGLEQINQFLGPKGRAYGQAEWEQIQAQRKTGKGFGAIASDTLFDGMVDESALKEEYAPESDDFFSQIGRSAVEAWSDPASLMNALDRGKLDFFDLYQDKIKEQFPDATPEQLDQLEEQYIGYLARKRSEAASEAVSDDAFAPWLIGQFLAVEPYDVVPIGRAAKAGTKVGRAAEKFAEGASIAVAGDVAGQALAINDGAQDEYDPLRTAISAGLSGTLAAGGQGIADVLDSGVRRLDRPTVESSAESSGTPAPIVVPTGETNTKAYREQLGQTQDQIIEQVNTLAKDWTNAPSIEVHPNFKALKGVEDNALGVYTEDGKVMINTEAVLERAKIRKVSPESVVEAVTFHEALGHHGLTQLFRDDLSDFLYEIDTKGSEEFRSEVDKWLRQNPDGYKNYSPEDRRILATEEVLAQWSEKNGILPRTIYDNIANTIKDFGRRMGMDLKYTTREVKAYLAVAQRRVTEGTPNGATPQVAKNVYYDDPSYGIDPETTSAGFKRPKVDSRLVAEDRKLRRKNAEEYDPFAPPKNRYMSGKGPIDPDDLTADDLIEAQNALDVLNRIDYTPTAIPVDQLEAEIVGRGINPSDVTRLVGLQPGALVKRLFQYDLAATKIGERVATITADIETNGMNDKNMADYVKSTVAFNDILDKLFDLQGEFGRSLAATRRANYSRKRVASLKEVLSDYGLETLSDPETFMRYMAATKAQMEAKKGKTTLTFGDKVISGINIPRAIMSSADLSAPLRQGVVFIGHKEYWGSFLKMFSMITPSGERNYKFLMEKIATHPNFELMQKARLAFSSLDGELSAREEDFQTEWARNIPVYGKVIKASEQAYAGFLNKLRADMFNKFVEQYQKAGVEVDDEVLKGLGEFINAGTGRAELPKWARPSSTVINATFFSGRLMYSRVQMLDPTFYFGIPGVRKGLPAPVRNSALASMRNFGVIALLVNGAINALWSDDVETEIDPRSSDFLKIKTGDTRFDIGGGFNQYLILGARTSTWLYNNTLEFGDRQASYIGQNTALTDYKVANKKTVAGKYKTYGNDEYNQDTYAGAIGQFFRSKFSPQASYAVDAMFGTDYIGNEFTVEGSLASRLVPMVASSIYDGFVEENAANPVLIGTTSLFGVGVNTYSNSNEDPDQDLKAPVSFEMKDLDDGENEDIRAENGEVTLKKAARDKWTATINNYYPVFLDQVTAQMGYKSFEDVPDNEKEAVIKKAKKLARYNAKEDMMYELGLEE